MTTHSFALEIDDDQGKFRITMRPANERPSTRLQQAGWHPSIEEAAANLGRLIPYILPRMFHMKTKCNQKAVQENPDA